MHTLLGLASVLPILIGSFLALGFLRRLKGWSHRRDLQLLILAAPVASLGLSAGELYHLATYICFIRTPSWDYLLSIALTLGMGLVALGGLGLGVIRLGLMASVMLRSRALTNPELQALTDDLRQRLGGPPVRLWLSLYDQPLAITVGLWQPTILLSTWMVEHLDQRELEAVLAHELGHVVRRDYLIIWSATLLRDAFCYLPTSWLAYRQLQHEKELACDELAVSATNRPLALASALAKTWQYALGQRSPSLAQSLIGGSQLIENRIERLMVATNPLTGALSSRLMMLAFGLGAFSLLVLAAAVISTLILAPMDCGPVSILWKLFS